MSILQIYSSPQNKLIEENKRLTDSLLMLEVRYAELNKKLQMNLKKAKEIQNLNENVERLEEENKNLNESLKRSEIENYESITKQEHKYLSEITGLKYELDIVNHKYVFINRLGSYVRNLEELNGDLGDTINRLELKHKKDLQAEIERNKIDLDEMKKKMMDVLTKAKNQANRQAHENMNVSSKLTVMQNLSLRNELGYQSELLEGMVAEKASKNKLIQELKIDLETQKEIQIALTQHNKKLIEIVKDVSNSMYTNSTRSVRSNSVADGKGLVCRCVCICNNVSKTNSKKSIPLHVHNERKTTTGSSFYNTIKTAPSENKPTNLKFGMMGLYPLSQRSSILGDKSEPIFKSYKIKQKNKKSGNGTQIGNGCITIMDSFLNDLKNGPKFLDK